MANESGCRHESRVVYIGLTGGRFFMLEYPPHIKVTPEEVLGLRDKLEQDSSCVFPAGVSVEVVDP